MNMEEKRLKIALCCDSFFPMVDGVINVLHNYAEILSKKHDVTVFVPESTDKKYVDNFPYKVCRCKNLPINFGDYVTPAPTLDRHFKKMLDDNFDIIHLHSPFTIAKAAVKVAKKRDIPIIVTLHSQFKKDFLEKTKSKLLTAFMMKYIAKTFNSCEELWTMNSKLEEMSHEYGYNGKVFLLPNGCDMKKQNIDNKKEDAIKSKYVQNGEHLLLFVGRIHRLKNIDFIFETCQHLKEKNFPFKMLFIGSGQDYDKYLKRRQEDGLEEELQFLGKITDREKLQHFYKASDLFIFPSYYDCDAIVKNEAAAFGTPTIFVEGAITASSVKDGVNGYVGKNDPAAFADKIVEIFNDEQKYKQVCINAEKTLFKTWDEIVEQAEKRYYQIIKSHKKK